jgi:hypothetical protein
MGRPLDQKPAVISERDQQIIDAYLAGDPVAAVAERFQVSDSRIRQITRWLPPREKGRVTDSDSQVPREEEADVPRSGSAAGDSSASRER